MNDTIKHIFQTFLYETSNLDVRSTREKNVRHALRNVYEALSERIIYINLIFPKESSIRQERVSDIEFLRSIFTPDENNNYVNFEHALSDKTGLLSRPERQLGDFERAVSSSMVATFIDAIMFHKDLSSVLA